MNDNRKIKIIKKLDKKKAVIKKIAKKMLPHLKKAEKERIEKLRSSE